MLDVYREACFSQKCQQTVDMVDLLRQGRVEKIVYGLETYWLFSKEKLPRVVISKDYADILLE